MKYIGHSKVFFKKAAKEYTCKACSGKIPKGERYVTLHHLTSKIVHIKGESLKDERIHMSCYERVLPKLVGEYKADKLYHLHANLALNAPIIVDTKRRD